METLIEVKDWNKTANNRNTNNKEDIENIAKGTTERTQASTALVGLVL